MFKEKWIEMLPDLVENLDKNYYDKIGDYLDVHSDFEVINKADETTIPLALRVLCELDLDRVEFVKLSDEVRTNVLKFNFDLSSYEGLSTDIIEQELNATVVKETTRMLKEIIEKHPVKIFMLFSMLDFDAGEISVFHRFYIEKEKGV